MKEINLRDYYPFYTKDTVVEVPDVVADLLREYKSEKQRNRICSHYLLGMSLSEIAKSEHSAVSSVHEGIQRGLRRLKKILEEI